MASARFTTCFGFAMPAFYGFAFMDDKCREAYAEVEKYLAHGFKKGVVWDDPRRELLGTEPDEHLVNRFRAIKEACLLWADPAGFGMQIEHTGCPLKLAERMMAELSASAPFLLGVRPYEESDDQVAPREGPRIYPWG